MIFETLTSSHNISYFNCGETKINFFLKSLALSWQQENLTSCKVLVNENKVIGFLTLSPSSVKKKYFSDITSAVIPRDIPVILLGMMGVDKTQKGNGIGGLLLVEALRWTYHLYTNSNLKFKALAVDALNDKSAVFFEYHGFQRIKNTNKLILSIQNIELQLQEANLI